jgi:hypothetical protein
MNYHAVWLAVLVSRPLAYFILAISVIASSGSKPIASAHSISSIRAMRFCPISM